MEGKSYRSVSCCGYAIYSVVEYTRFKRMVKVLEPWYNVPSCVHCSQSVAPAMFKQGQAAFVQELSTAYDAALLTLCHLFVLLIFFLIDNTPISECLNCYSTNYGQ